MALQSPLISQHISPYLTPQVNSLRHIVIKRCPRCKGCLILNFFGIELISKNWFLVVFFYRKIEGTCSPNLTVTTWYEGLPSFKLPKGYFGRLLSTTVHSLSVWHNFVSVHTTAHVWNNWVLENTSPLEYVFPGSRKGSWDGVERGKWSIPGHLIFIDWGQHLLSYHVVQSGT